MILEFLPSLGWFLFYGLGASLNFLNLQDESLHFLLTCVILILLSASDFICFKRSSLRTKEDFAEKYLQHKSLSKNTLTICIVGIVLIILALRLYIVGLDIVFQLINEGYSNAVVESRVAHTRDLKYPAFIFYVINWNYLFLAPWAISLLTSYRNNFTRLMSFLIFSLTLFTSLMAAERLPLIIFLTSCSCFACFLLLKGKRFRKTLQFVGVLFISSILFVSLASYGLAINCKENLSSTDLSFQIIDQSSSIIKRKNDLKQSLYDLSISDKLELCNNSNIKFIRRIIWIPSDVGRSYFLLFPKHISFYNYQNSHADKLFDGLPNLVGNLVYRSKFPDSYMQSVRAYSSFFSDSYARLGLFGAIFSITLLIFLRASLFVYSIQVGTAFYPLYLFSLCGLFLLPAQSSIQAILIAHGILPILLILALSVRLIPQDKVNNA